MSQSSQPQPQLQHIEKASEAPSSPLLDSIVATTEQGRSEAQQTQVKQTIIDILARSPQVQDSRYSADLESLIDRRLALIDEAVSAQLDKIMHEPKFQELEANWRGLDQLVTNTRLSKELRIKTLDITRRELDRDLGVSGAKLKSYQDSALFDKLHDQEYGTPGGTPFGALIGAFNFSNDEHDCAALLQISKIAATSHAPFIASASPKLFGWNSFGEIQGGNALFKLVEGDEHVHWNRFRENPDSRYVGLVLPRYLSRTPHRREEGSSEFTYDENRTEASGPKFLWGNAAFAYGQVLTRAFADYGWCTAIRGQENGGALHLPFFSSPGFAMNAGPTEVAINHGQERELSSMGFLALSQIKGSSEAVFYGGQSCQLPTAYYEHEVQESADLSARLPYIFAVSRFAHHLKAMMYRQIGSSKSQDQLEKLLKNWIGKFILDKGPSATMDEKAELPLASASVEVYPVPGKVGEYHAVLSLRPHIQMERIDIAFRLVSAVPKDAVK